MPLYQPEPAALFGHRPVSTSTDIFGAVVAVEGFIADGLFAGQSSAFLTVIRNLAKKADAAQRQV